MSILRPYLKTKIPVLIRTHQYAFNVFSSLQTAMARSGLLGSWQEADQGAHLSVVAIRHFSSSGRGGITNFRNSGSNISDKVARRMKRRMQEEGGRTLREIRRAKKLRKKLMTQEERLIFSLRRAKKKVALLLQKLKKYELPELPPPHHDPELLTPEQIQNLKKLGFKNKNYVPVGVRGVFGGVVQNMHLHWKFHETVQVCCDNFPKEKIKEMATMLARLSGGIVINIHDVKTIIMYRGRNYRQPKVLIPVNTLTKRKALFKARFEQALESQKINIKKTEQELRRMGVNPEDPIAMASVKKVASTFFRAIDDRHGTPYVFDDIKPTTPLESDEQDHISTGEDSDQEELDKFIADIERAADEEWAAEEAAEKEEAERLRYWNRDDFRNGWGNQEDRQIQRSARTSMNNYSGSDDEDEDEDQACYDESEACDKDEEEEEDDFASNRKGSSRRNREGESQLDDEEYWGSEADITDIDSDDDKRSK